jgi:hypothetical protein
MGDRGSLRVAEGRREGSRSGGLRSATGPTGHGKFSGMGDSEIAPPWGTSKGAVLADSHGGVSWESYFHGKEDLCQLTALHGRRGVG